MTDTASAQPDFTEYASEIVSAYVAHNSIPMAELPNLLRSVHDTLASLGQPASAEAPAAPLTPPVSVKKSIHNDYLVSMEDGRQYQSLKRHLSTRGLTPAEYRAKWGLPADYPMVAPGYSARRSELAKTIGLGRKGGESIPAAPEPETAAPAVEEAAPTAKRGRAKKAA